MWSGPRNISTAMMRAWGSRPDTHVVDEPFYAFYLHRTGLDHPGREVILRSQPTGWREVAEALTRGPLPDGATLLYQKHMTHHLLPEIDRSALSGLRHAFLIRDPAEVLASYTRVRGEPTLTDLGLPQQVALHERFPGPVIDARDVLERPEPMLRALCAALEVEYAEEMLRWEPGPRQTDGVWGQHWYDGVWRSTGFAPYRSPLERVPARLQPLLDRCRPYYDTMAEHRLTA
jgi:hypothetical protein